MKYKVVSVDGSMLLPVIFIAIFAIIPVAWLVIPDSPQIFGRAVHNVKTKEKVVALTFDDGPNPVFTNQILHVLKKHEIKATFFVVGERAQVHPEVVKQVYNAGHEIGNHSWSHKVLVGKSSSFIRKQIEKTDKLIRELGYEGQIYFRSPKGMKFIALPKVLAKMKRDNILFDVVGWDWSCPGTKKIVKNVLDDVHAGSIILLHDGDCDKKIELADRSQTVAAADIIIQRLKDKGYRFVVISELLKLGKKE